MMIKLVRFNIYLCAALALATLCGCLSLPHKDKEKKEVSTVELHLEQDPDGLSDIGPVTIYRSSPITVSVDKEPFLDSRALDQASVVDEPGGLFSIRLKFNWEGTAILDGVTAANPGKRIAVAGDFGEKRWLASPIIRERVSNGVITFTPDATHEEAERIVRGLNNVAKEIKKGQKHQNEF